MAYADYTHCAVCDAKAFYDANVDWESQNSGEVAALCLACSKTHEVKVLPREKPLAEAHTMTALAKALEDCVEWAMRNAEGDPLPLEFEEARAALAALVKEGTH